MVRTSLPRFDLFLSPTAPLSPNANLIRVKENTERKQMTSRDREMGEVFENP